MNTPAAPSKPPLADPQPNLAHTQAFLRAIGRDGVLHFRAIRKGLHGKGDVRIRKGSHEELHRSLLSLNDEGFCVFVQVNPSDGKGESAANIVDAHCFFADFDGTPHENVKRLGLPPQITVTTSPGKFHFYWRVDGIPLDQFSKVQQRLIRLFGSDKSVHDLPRVMRLPGYLHKKNPATPHLVTCEVDEEREPYSYVDFLAALQAAERAAGIVAQERSAVRPLPTTPVGTGDVARAESALRYLVAHDALDLGDYHEWIRMGIALKNSFQEDAWSLFLTLSSEAEGYKGKDDVRKRWDSIRDGRSDGERLTVATYVRRAQDAGWKFASEATAQGADPANTGSEGEGISGPESGKVRNVDPASVIITSTMNANDDVFLTPDGKPHVTFDRRPGGGAVRRVTVPLESGEYQDLLALRYHEETATKTASKDKIQAALRILRARAMNKPRVPVYLRSAFHEGSVYVLLDPNAGLVAKIDASGWHILDGSPPIRFVLGSRGALPAPVSGGELGTFSAHFNVSGEDLLRIVGFMLATFFAGNANPLLLVEGQAGSAKSTMADKVLALTDPPNGNHAAGRFSMATEERNLHVQASRCSVLLLDNVTRFSADVADQLCRLLTGGALSTRKLHTDGDEHQSFIARPCIATCIGAPSNRGDLLDRTLRVVAQPVNPRRTEASVWNAFSQDAGKMVGFLFDCVATALRNRSAIDAMVESQQVRPPRLADFAAWVEAASGKLGLKPGEFSDLLRAEQEVLQRSAAEGDPLVEALVGHFSNGGAALRGITAKEVLLVLGSYAPPGTLPATNKLKDRVQRLADGLRVSGFDIKVGRNPRDKVATFDIATNDHFVAESAGGGKPLPIAF